MAEKVTVELLGHDGNAFYIMGKVIEALKKHGYSHLASRFVAEVNNAKSYDEFLRITQKYVEVV